MSAQLATPNSNLINAHKHRLGEDRIKEGAETFEGFLKNIVTAPTHYNYPFFQT